ncbi:MAG: hypothetical protein KIT80_10050 [Chitinophagaceae bacterium]|nr:hypothetical protein [Chitinophagaceae bacterium]MCW5927242.1 hypothetical protein [Chitinophagaceae bacterium]
MARIPPLEIEAVDNKTAEAFRHHTETYSARITNMKATLAYSLLSFEVYMQWYPLYNRVKQVVGERLAYLFAWSVSTASDCPLCSTFFRKIIIDAGEDPEHLQINAGEQELLDFGAAITRRGGRISDEVFNAVASKYTNEETVLLIAFAGQMIATNIFNNVIETNIDGYLADYIKPTL